MGSMNIFVMGAPGSGKTTLVKALLSDNHVTPNLNSDPSRRMSSSSMTSLASTSSNSAVTSDIVHVSQWEINDVTANSSIHTVNLWDLPGNIIYQEANMLYITGASLVLVTMDADKSFTDLVSILTSVYNRCPEARVILVLTHGDRSSQKDNKQMTERAESALKIAHDWLEAKNNLVKRHINEVKCALKDLTTSRTASPPGSAKEKDSILQSLTVRYNTVLKASINIYDTVYTVSSVSGIGISDLKKAITDVIKTYDKNCAWAQFQQGQELAKLCRETLEDFQLKGEVLLSWKRFQDSLHKRIEKEELLKNFKKEERIQMAAKILRASGHIFDTQALPGKDPPDGEAQAKKDIDLAPGTTSATSGSKDKTATTTTSTTSGSKDKTATTTTSTTSVSKDKTATTTTSATSGSKDKSATTTTVRPPSHTVDTSQVVCSSPQDFANIVCSSMVLDDKRTFRLEASRFWPEDSGFKPPEPALLAKILEAIPHKGLIREAVLPIIWQDFDLDQDQIRLCLNVLGGQGAFMPQTLPRSDCAGLAMPDFRILSPLTCHNVILMDLLPTKKPQLNWTTKPFPGDLQMVWRLTNVTGMSITGLKRCLALVKRTTEAETEYSYIWSSGLLIKCSDVTVCIEHKPPHSIDIACRVNADDPESREVAVRLLWAYAVPVVQVIEHFFGCQMTGIVFKSSLVLHGSGFYQSDQSPSPLDSVVMLENCLLAWHNGKDSLTLGEGNKPVKINLRFLFPFTGADIKKVYLPDTFKELIMSRRSQILADHSPQKLDVASETAQKRNLSQKKNRVLQKKKGIEVKWKSKLEETPGSETKDSEQSPSDAGKVSQTSPTVNSTQGTESALALTQPMSKDDWMKQATELASRFVSAMMASGVAKYVALHADGSQVAVTAQITAAKVTADAAMAVHSGDIDKAARAVVEAVNAVQLATDTAQDMNMGGSDSLKKRKESSNSKEGKASRFCTIL